MDNFKIAVLVILVIQLFVVIGMNNKLSKTLYVDDQSSYWCRDKSKPCYVRVDN